MTARDGEDILMEVGSYFLVLPMEQADRVHSNEDNLRRMMQENPNDDGPLFLSALLYEENGMLDEAVQIYGELAQRIVPQEWVQAHMAELINKLGWDKLPVGRPR